MKLAIICNYGPPHCGGSEEVLKNISKYLISEYNYEITIFARNYKQTAFWKGINLSPCPKGSALIPKLKNFDHIFIYSDSQWNFTDIVSQMDKISSKVSVALVGAYHLRSHPSILSVIKKNIDRINFITHSSVTPDYNWCVNKNIDVTVIPNGVNLSEFNTKNISFREKYGIKERYIILSVSNFFFGKGFDLIPKVCKEIDSKDVVFVSISNTIEYPYDKVFLKKTINQSNGLNVKFLRDLPRKDVISAFQSADIFLSYSKKEVAPLVILESQASATPWVSMDVGDTITRRGGIVIQNPKEDNKGYKIVDSAIINMYAKSIIRILESEDLRSKLINDAIIDIEQLDWNNISSMYNLVFNS